MNKLFVKILPGLIPLIIFIIVDELLGVKAGILVASVFGAVELLVIWLKTRILDKFVIIDTLLIVVLGLLSLLLDSPVFFKIKPAITSVLLLVFIGIIAFTDSKVIFSFSKRYFKDFEFTQEQNILVKKKFTVFFFVMLAYTALVFYSVWFMSNKAWAFVGGVLIYIVFGVFFIADFIITRYKIRRQNNNLHHK